MLRVNKNVTTLQIGHFTNLALKDTQGVGGETS